MNRYARQFYTRDQVKMIIDAYQHIFGPIGAELREYWDLDRGRAWGCLTTDFWNASFEKYEEASHLAEDIESGIKDPIERGCALREVTKKTKVGLSLGVCPWTDHGLFQTYEKNKHKGRVIIILGHDWYPIAPKLHPRKKQHPVDVPLSCEPEPCPRCEPGSPCKRGFLREPGLLGAEKYVNVRAVPQAIVDKSELLLFLNLNPDFRPPNTSVSGRFEPSIYQRCAKGFNALVEAVSRNFKVQVISWGAPVWEALREQVNEDSKSLSVMENAKERSGRLLELRCGKQIVRYLPLAHPCWAPNFKKPFHAVHAREGFRRMGLDGAGA